MKNEQFESMEQIHNTNKTNFNSGNSGRNYETQNNNQNKINQQMKNIERVENLKDVKSTFSSKQFNNITGSSAEQKACDYLKSVGYRIVKRNYKVSLGEIDIVAYDGDTLCFVEVKFRKTDYFGLPREAVNFNKQRKIRMVATCFLKQYKLFDKLIRFDVVDILGDKIELIKNCF